MGICFIVFGICGAYLENPDELASRNRLCSVGIRFLAKRSHPFKNSCLSDLTVYADIRSVHRVPYGNRKRSFYTGIGNGFRYRSYEKSSLTQNNVLTR